MCPPMRTHWRHLVNTIQHVLGLRPTWVHNPNGKSIGSAVFAAHSTVSLRKLSPPANTYELLLPSVHQSPQPKQKIDRLSHFCTALRRVSSGTLTPPGEYDWTCASFHPLESTTQMADWSAQPFLHSWQQKIPIFYNWRLNPPKLTLPMGIWPPSNTWFLWPIQAHNSNGIWMGSTVFAQMTAEYPYTLQCDAPLPPQNCPFPWGIWTPSNNGSLGPPESSTAYRSFQLFMQGSPVWQADQPCYSVGNNRLHLCTLYCNAA